VIDNLHPFSPLQKIDFVLNNQPDALIIQIYSVIKLYMFRASSLPIIRNFSTVHSALVSFVQVSDDRFQAQSGCSVLTVLGSGHQKPARNIQVPNLQWKTPDDGQRKCPKHVEFYDKTNLDN
jgi:hypothetical protein